MRKIIFIVIAVSFLAGCKKESPQGEIPITGKPQVSAEQEITILKDILSKDPDNLDALIKLGNISMDAKRFKEAIDAYEKALKIDPKNVDVRVDMGTCFRNIGMPDRAVQEYRKAISIDPNHLNAHRNLAVVLAYDIGDKKGAADEFEAYLRLNPSDPDAAALRGEIEKLRGR
jgi:tetratricopeptide (TPR) repeat protein